MKKALFVHNLLTTFVRIDRDLLSKHYSLTELDFHWTISKVLEMLRQVAAADVIFAWFASHHSFFPAVLGHLLGKKVIIFAADYDIAKEPEHHYGSMRGGIPKLVNNLIFRVSDVVIVTSQFSAQLALDNTVVKPSKVHIIHCGLPSLPAPERDKEAIVVTIAKMTSDQIWRKGVDVFLDMGHYLPDIPCYLVGRAKPELLQQIEARKSPNTTLTGYLSEADLYDLLARAAVYAQLSYMEGFGLAVAEAMLHQCVPVVTDRGALRDVVGETGVYVPYNDAQAAAQGIREALQQPELGAAARQRVMDLFNLEQREKMLLTLLADAHAL